MNRYVLNSAVMTTFGVYQYQPLTVANAKGWLQCAPFTSTIGYEETAVAASALIGVEIPLNRIVVKMAVEDEALVFRLVFPSGSPRLDISKKGAIDVDFILDHCEIGLLTRLR